MKLDIENMFKNLLEDLDMEGGIFCRGFRSSDEEDIEQESPESEIASILVNENKRVITVTFADGDVKMSKCSEKDEFDVKVGVALCVLYHMFGSNTKASKIIEQKAKFVAKKKKEESKVKVTKGKLKSTKDE